MKPELLSLCVMIFACSAFAAHAHDATAVERRVVSRGNVDIEVLSQGAGPVIVLLPSLGRSGEDYEAVAAMLASRGFRVVRPQPRGIGRSKGPMDGLNMHDLAADVASVVESENTGSVVVVGHAFGNFVARQTRRRPARSGAGRGARGGLFRQGPSGLDGKADRSRNAPGDRRSLRYVAS